MSPDDFRKLVAAGLNTEQIALVMEMIEAKDKAFAEAEEARRAKGRERVAKWRETHKDERRNVTETSPNVTEPLVRDRVAPAEDNQTNNKQPSSKKNTTAADEAAFRAALASLGGDRLDGVIKVRRAKKAPVTGYAASLFIKAAETCDLSIEAAADLCIERNWLTVRPEWITKPQPRGSPAQPSAPRPSMLGALNNLLSYMEHTNGPEPDPNGSSLPPNVRYLAASGR